MEGENNKYKRISKVSAVFMVGTAVLFDLIELILDLLLVGIVLSYVIDIAATVTFSIWFMIKGVSLSSPKAVSRFWVTNIAELLPIPVIDFCLTTLGVVLMIRTTWREDSGESEDDKIKAVAELSRRMGKR